MCRGWCYILKPEEREHLSLLQRRDVEIKSHREKVKEVKCGMLFSAAAKLHPCLRGKCFHLQTLNGQTNC